MQSVALQDFLCGRPCLSLLPLRRGVGVSTCPGLSVRTLRAVKSLHFFRSWPPAAHIHGTGQVVGQSQVHKGVTTGGHRNAGRWSPESQGRVSGGPHHGGRTSGATAAPHQRRLTASINTCDCHEVKVKVKSPGWSGQPWWATQQCDPFQVKPRGGSKGHSYTSPGGPEPHRRHGGAHRGCHGAEGASQPAS